MGQNNCTALHTQERREQTREQLADCKRLSDSYALQRRNVIENLAMNADRPPLRSAFLGVPRGIVLNSPIGALGLYPAGRRANARAAYQDFFSLWKDADSGIPILKQAKGEYAKMH